MDSQGSTAPGAPRAPRRCHPGAVRTYAATGRTMSTTSAGSPDAVTPGHVDVLIVGAGLSGIGAACHLQAEAPGTSYALVEARGASGGTWDLFRFPGVRSDSGMITLRYRFLPW